MPSSGWRITSVKTLSNPYTIKNQPLTTPGFLGTNQININAPFSKIILMTGVQTFPTPIEAHSIEEVSDLIFQYSKYNVKLGFSDHVDGSKKESFILPLMAFSAGAGVIEKHLTFNRKDKWIDYHSALSFNNFKDFC